METAPLQERAQDGVPNRDFAVRASTAVAARGWLVTLGLVAAVGVFMQLAASWPREDLVVVLAFVSLVFVGPPILVHFVFGVMAVVVSGERIAIALRRRAPLEFVRGQVVGRSVFRIPRLSVELLRLVTARGTRWLSLSGFGDEDRTRIRALLEPALGPGPIPWRRKLAMRLRGVPAGAVRRAFDTAREHDLPVTLDMLEAHALVGGNVERVVAAALRARERGRALGLLELFAADASGRDLDALVEGVAGDTGRPVRKP